MLKYLLAIIAVIVTALSAVGITVDLALSRAIPSPLWNDLPGQYLPGRPLPANSYCDWYMYDSRSLFCTARSADGAQFFFSYDISSKVIRRTTVETTPQLTIGELMLQWGTPIATDQIGQSTYVYWKQRSAYVYGSDFSPRSRVAFVTYWLDLDTKPGWKGFTRPRWSGL